MIFELEKLLLIKSLPALIKNDEKSKKDIKLIVDKVFNNKYPNYK